MSTYVLKKMQEILAEEEKQKEKAKLEKIYEALENSEILKEKVARFNELRDQFIKEAREELQLIEQEQAKIESLVKTVETLKHMYSLLMGSFVKDDTTQTVVIVLQRDPEDPKSVKIAKIYQLGDQQGKIEVDF